MRASASSANSLPFAAVLPERSIRARIWLAAASGPTASAARRQPRWQNHVRVHRRAPPRQPHSSARMLVWKAILVDHADDLADLAGTAVDRLHRLDHLPDRLTPRLGQLGRFLPCRLARRHSPPRWPRPR